MRVRAAGVLDAARRRNLHQVEPAPGRVEPCPYGQKVRVGHVPVELDARHAARGEHVERTAHAAFDETFAVGGVRRDGLGRDDGSGRILVDHAVCDDLSTDHRDRSGLGIELVCQILVQCRGEVSGDRAPCRVRPRVDRGIRFFELFPSDAGRTLYCGVRAQLEACRRVDVGGRDDLHNLGDPAPRPRFRASAGPVGANTPKL